MHNDFPLSTLKLMEHTTLKDCYFIKAYSFTFCYTLYFPSFQTKLQRSEKMNINDIVLF